MNSPKSVEEPMLTVTSAHGVGTFMAEAEVKPFMLGQRSCGAAGSTDKLASTIAGAGEPGGGTGRGDASAVNHRAGMDGPGWTGRDGRARMDGPGRTGQDGRARMDGPGRRYGPTTRPPRYPRTPMPVRSRR